MSTSQFAIRVGVVLAALLLAVLVTITAVNYSRPCESPTGAAGNARTLFGEPERNLIGACL